MSRQHLHKLLARYRAGGLDAVEPRSRRPRSNPAAVDATLRERIIHLRTHLTGQGLDAGPVTIAWHLEQEGLRVPSTSTIRRILHAAGLVKPEPRKRPKNSYTRFEADFPNECWQSDFTHWRLADGTDIEILNWLDDHSRFLISCTAHIPVTGDDVITTFLTATEEHGTPASTLTDNGRVYTARFGGGRNAFEHLLPLLGVKQKNGSPGHPQTQGKIERFHQTLKRFLAAQPAAATLHELQRQLDRFREHYNEHRPHRARDRTTPRNRLPDHPESRPRLTPRRPLPAPLRPSRQRRPRLHPPRRPHAPPRHRPNPHRQTHPRPRRPHHHHRHPPQHRRNPLPAPHRPHPRLLAQPTTRARPMAGLSFITVVHVATQVSPMSRLITLVEPRGIEPLTSCLQSRRSTN